MADGARCASVAASCVAFNLRRATRSITQHYDAVLRLSGLRVTQFSVLVALRLAEPCPLSELAELLGMDRTTLTRNLGWLEDRGFVQAASGSDRRIRLISTTSSGQEALEIALPLWEQAQSETLEAIGAERWAALIPELRDLSQGHVTRKRSKKSKAHEASVG